MPLERCIVELANCKKVFSVIFIRISIKVTSFEHLLFKKLNYKQGLHAALSSVGFLP